MEQELKEKISENKMTNRSDPFIFVGIIIFLIIVIIIGVIVRTGSFS